MASLRAVFFDLDDTLCETSQTLPYRMYAALEAIARRDSLGQPIEHYINALYDLPEHQRRLPQLFDLLRVTDTSLIQEATHAHDAASLNALQIADGALEMLEDLRLHLDIGLVSNGRSAYQREKLARLGLAPYFPTPFISEEVGFEKPDPRIFQIALSQGGIRPEEAVYVGNAWDTDILGATRAGMGAILVSNEPAPGPQAIHTIPGIKHLPIVLRLSGALSL